ncbi:hypothetical protein F2Q68_00016154 [Brassica cretica]|uniref:Uncharacterized protein n=1 Tax=Brassica cretica TaxID=69181 RepID=A0A8S9HH53_BRACR|nr:hypothetical protein F2Q68_00016154 [Brassica cretica]
MYTEEYDEDYEDERVTEYKAILDEEDTLLHHSSWKRIAPSIDIPGSPSIDTQPPQRNRKRALTDIANYSSIDAEVNRVREGDYSIGSWEDVHHHESYVVETAIYEPGAYELHEGFTYEELLNMQRRDETDQHRSDTAWGRTRYTHPIDGASDRQSTPDPYGHRRAIDGRILNVSRKDIADNLQTPNGAENLSPNPTRPSVDVDAPTSVDRQPEFCRRAFDSHGTKKFYWEEKDQYGVCRDEQGYT